jgi:hypothetical protein
MDPGFHVLKRQIDPTVIKYQREVDECERRLDIGLRTQKSNYKFFIRYIVPTSFDALLNTRHRQLGTLKANRDL